jgi:hypothetical protein
MNTAEVASDQCNPRMDNLHELSIFTGASYYVVSISMRPNTYLMATAWQNDKLIGYTGQGRWLYNTSISSLSANGPLQSRSYSTSGWQIAPNCSDITPVNSYGADYATWMTNGANAPDITWIGCGITTPYVLRYSDIFGLHNQWFRNEQVYIPAHKHV